MDNILSHILWALSQILKPSMEKLTIWWPDYSHYISCYNWETWPQRNANKMQTSRPWNWRLTIFETIKLKLVRPPMTNLKLTVRDNCAISACGNPLLSIKPLAPLVSAGGSQPLDRCLPFPLVAGIWNKANFPFHQPNHLICFGVASRWTPTFGIRVCHFLSVSQFS